MKNIWRAAAVTGIAAAGVLAFGVGPAHAAGKVTPKGISCSYSNQDTQVGVVCSYPGPTNTRFAAWATCTDGRTHWGVWEVVNSGYWSWATCPTNRFVTDYGYATG